MRGNLQKDCHGNVVIHMEGDIDYAYSSPFKSEIETLLKNNPLTSITLDLSKVDFVGSSGICHFVDSLKKLNNSESRVKLSNVSEEFQRLFKLYNLDPTTYSFDFGMDDDNVEDLNQRFGNRNRTFEN